MRRNSLSIILFLLVSILCLWISSCKLSKQNTQGATQEPYSTTKYLEAPDSATIDSLLRIWKDDSISCKKNRSFYLFDNLVSYWDLRNKSIVFNQEILGKPDEIFFTGNSIVSIIYYVETRCIYSMNDFKSVNAKPLCWVRISISSFNSVHIEKLCH